MLPPPLLVQENLRDGIANGTVICYWLIRHLSNDRKRPIDPRRH